MTDDDGAVKKYGLFRGHAAKPYYETVDGVGTLLFALLELDDPDMNLGGIFRTTVLTVKWGKETRCS